MPPPRLLKSVLRCLPLWLCLTAALSTASDAPPAGNPFQRFFGEWTLKDDQWRHNWGQGDEQITIPRHHTVSKPLNTENSVLSVVDAPDPKGHILWSYNRSTRQVHHLSSFGAARNGVGVGTVSAEGDLRLRVTFEGEPGTYRFYTYTWISDDEYELLSTQYDERNHQPTGRFYGGTFVRIHPDAARQRDLAAVQAILKTIDNTEAELATQLSVYADNIVHMAPDHPVITSKAELAHHLAESRKNGRAEMKHEVIDLFSYDDIVLMRGRVTGTYHPNDNRPPSHFRTKNLFVFRRQEDASLKVWKVIFNFSPDP